MSETIDERTTAGEPAAAEPPSPDAAVNADPSADIDAPDAHDPDVPDTAVAGDAAVDGSDEPADAEGEPDVAGKRTGRGGDRRAEAKRVLEALLFASGEILTPAKLKTIVPGNPDARKLRDMVEAINGELQAQRHPFHILEIAGGYQIRTVPSYSPWVRQLLKEKTTKRLSIQALECLAIITYRQPITKAEIEAVRGTISDGAMKTLLERRMVTITGRSDKAGRPLLYGTTREFLEYFGLRGIDELPRLEEFEAMAKEKMGDVGQELEQMQKERLGDQPPVEEDLPQIERSDESIPRLAAEEIDETLIAAQLDGIAEPAGDEPPPAAETPA